MINLFSGTTSINLSNEVSNLLKIKLSEAEIIRFDNSELRVRILSDVKNNNAFVIQSGANPTDQSYIELFFFADALKRSGANKIIAVIPYFGYARQNIQHREGECVSEDIIIKFLETSGYHEVIIFDIHAEETLQNFSIPVKHLSAIGLLAEKIKSYLKENIINPEKYVVVTPDEAGLTRAKRFSEVLFQNNKTEVAIIEKYRDLNKLHVSQAVKLIGDVKDKIAIIVDDIVTSGNTLINASNMILKNGAKRVIAAIIHHDFSQTAPEKIQNSSIDKFFTTNSIRLNKDQIFNKLEEVSIAKMLAAEIINVK